MLLRIRVITNTLQSDLLLKLRAREKCKFGYMVAPSVCALRKHGVGQKMLIGKLSWRYLQLGVLVVLHRFSDQT